MNRLICRSNSQIKVSHFAKLLLAVGATLCFLGRLHATGYYGPDFYLDDGGKNVDGSPEFYWGLEVRRLAKEFHPTEKRVVSEKAEHKSDEEASDNSDLSDATEDADLKDFDVALKEGRIKPPDPAKAKEEHKLAREIITSPTAEFDSEFADYHRGAGAYLNKNWEEARNAWEDLLKRPEQDRHYRTVWAAFMLGKLGLKTNDYQSASQWFQRTREFAKAGFADSLGLGAESYGWEGRAEWKQEHPEKAAPLFLTQLALGDPSAVVSLKALIPDREPVEGMWNFGGIEDAEYLGWVAYNNGDYKGAAHWLELSKGGSGAALWLRAKLQRRDGKLGEAAKTMAQAVESLRSAPAYNPTAENDEKWTEYDYFPEGPDWGWGQSAHGDLGELRLARGDFVQAFDTLFKGHLWNDAAFVAERVLTTKELKEYVDALLGTPPPKEGEDYNAKLKYLLGRRLVREDRYADAEPYMSPPYDKVLEKYVKALKDGANEKLSKTERAHAWFTAAWLARYDGMELMGTEVAPDAFADSGAFEFPDLAKQRRSGFYQQVSYDKDGNQKAKNVPIALKASQKEIQRLTANKIEPDIRFHYRLIAGALAIKAAALLPDNSEELADVVNQAGLWVKDRDEKTGNRYYQIIDRRCPKTKIGQADVAKHWFGDQTGPWSASEEEAYRAMHKELEPEPSSE